MEDLNNNIHFEFDRPANIPSVVKVIGVGECGREVVDELFASGDYDMHDIDSATIDPTQPSAQLADTVSGFLNLVFVVCSTDDETSVRTTSELCRQFLSVGNETECKVAIVLPVCPIGEAAGSCTAEKNLAMLNAAATKLYPLTEGCATRPCYNVVNTICRVFMNIDIAHVDYNDVATVLQSGTRFLWTCGEGSGEGRGEKALAAIMQNLAALVGSLADIEYMMLLIGATKEHELIVAECYDIFAAVERSVGRPIDTLWNYTELDPCDGDTLRIQAIAIC